MAYRIFLSHNHNDKPLVEAVALKLAGIFGQDQVFYDSWSIRPGDGIIDQMNKGLEAPEFVFFFVSANASFTPQHQGFSNLTFIQTIGGDGSIEIAVQASHLMEPNPNFAFVTQNAEADIGWEMKNNQPFIGGFNNDAFISGNGIAHAISMRPMGTALTPSHPMRVRFTKKGAAPINIIAVFHHKGETEWVPVPAVPPRPARTAGVKIQP